jgi:hypothetical protein
MSTTLEHIAQSKSFKFIEKIIKRDEQIVFMLLW